MLKQIGITKRLQPNSIANTASILVNRSASLRRTLLESKFKKNKLDIFGFTSSRQNPNALGLTSSIPLVLSDDMQNHNHSALEECLHKMPIIQRKAFMYKTFECKKTALICEDLHINEAVFWKLIHNARKELITALDLN